MRVWNPTRRGLSVIEALVGCALIVLLAMFVLPAVEWARGSAVENYNRNNLRRIGLGMHAYHDTHNSFPATKSPAQPSASDGQPKKK
jgi:hypothetical protein